MLMERLTQWRTPIIPMILKLWQVDQEFRASPGCNGTCLKTIRTPTADQNGKTKTRTRKGNVKRPKIGTGLCVVLILISSQIKGCCLLLFNFNPRENPHFNT